MRRVFIAVFAVAVLLASATPGLAGHAWNTYHWEDEPGDPHDGSITLTIVDDLSAYTALYPAVIDDWDNSDGSPGPLTLNSSSGTSRPSACDNDATDAAGATIAGTIHVCNGSYGKNGWLGLARIWLGPDGHIDAGVALMNDSYMLEPGSSYNDATAQRHVLCQEIGHTFGLGHQGGKKNRSCMNDRWGLTDPRYESPNGHDFDMLDEIYGAASRGGGGGKTKPCNPKSPKCGADAEVAPRPGGGWIVTYTVPVAHGRH